MAPIELRMRRARNELARAERLANVARNTIANEMSGPLQGRTLSHIDAQRRLLTRAERDLDDAIRRNPDQRGPTT